MTAFDIARLHSIQRETPQSESQSKAQQDEYDIAKLAYALWQHRGCCEGSAEQNWLEAEQTVRLAAQRI